MLAETLIIFCCKLGLPLVSKFTSISPFSPGLIGIFLGYSGTVQPQLPTASTIYKSFSPVLVNENIVFAISPSFTLPKS